MKEWDRNVYGPMWAEGMQDFYRWYDNIRSGLNEEREKGVASYRESLASRQLQFMLEKLRDIRPPEIKGCKEVVNDLKKSIECEIKFREIDVKVVEDPSSRSLAAKASWWLSLSDQAERKSRKKFDSLCE